MHSLRKEEGVAGLGAPPRPRAPSRAAGERPGRSASALLDAAREPAAAEPAALEQHGETVYHVRDNGAGFDMAYADKLFTLTGKAE